jgi:hypothetical protein
VKTGRGLRVDFVLVSPPMKAHHPLLLALAASCLAALPVTLTACDSGGSATAANIKPSGMPEGEQWTGVYFHPVYGYLHLVEQDTNIIGKWKRADQSAWGELSGTKNGNVFHFTWKEHKYGLVGPAAEQHGKGVFVFKIGGNKIPELDGQFGLNDDEVGSDWHNVKQQNVKPDLQSITGDLGGTAPAGAGKWDDK